MTDLHELESTRRHREHDQLERAEVAQLAARMWGNFTKDEKTLVRFGMFPYAKMLEAEQGITHITEGSRLLAVALMDCAKANGGMRA
jgi:hypothetical protein